MPRKNSKQALINTIMSRINYMTRELACRDRKIEILLAQRNLDLQDPDGFFKSGECDRYLDRTFEETLYNEDDIPFGHLPDPDNPIDIDMFDFWRGFLSSPYVFWLYLLLRRRLIGSVYRRPSRTHDGAPGDPCGILPSLKAITPDQLERLASKLKRALPPPNRHRPKKRFCNENLENIGLVRDVEESLSKSKSERRAVEAVISKDDQSRKQGIDDTVRNRFRRTSKRIRDYSK